MIVASEHFQNLNGPTFYKTGSVNNDTNKQIHSQTAESTIDLFFYFPVKVQMHVLEIVCCVICREKKPPRLMLCSLTVRFGLDRVSVGNGEHLQGQLPRKSNPFLKILFSCGVIRIKLPNASYNYSSKCAAKSPQSYFSFDYEEQRR